MQALKGLIAVMGALIVIALAILGYGLYQKAKNPDFKFFNLSGVQQAAPRATPRVEASGAAQGLTQSRASVAPFGDLNLNMDRGTRILSSQLIGNHLLLQVRRPDGTDAVAIVDVTRGIVLGVVTVAP